eukprot:TRINITY_DN29281_c0_g1_i1.p2 TRINITY_DN29281_c0_g1~~TRINITY_DN29281_c0_g1_i1.p2  ORF type:complete len:107 (+),score=11.63 TRINITY_DN29281_c0_g1_i1:1102-1422(+)
MAFFQARGGTYSHAEQRDQAAVIWKLFGTATRELWASSFWSCSSLIRCRSWKDPAEDVALGIASCRFFSDTIDSVLAPRQLWLMSFCLQLARTDWQFWKGFSPTLW